MDKIISNERMNKTDRVHFTAEQIIIKTKKQKLFYSKEKTIRKAVCQIRRYRAPLSAAHTMWKNENQKSSLTFLNDNKWNIIRSVSVFLTIFPIKSSLIAI